MSSEQEFSDVEELREVASSRRFGARPSPSFEIDWAESKDRNEKLFQFSDRSKSARSLTPIDKEDYRTLVRYKWDLYKNQGEFSPFTSPTFGNFVDVLPRKIGDEEGWQEPNAAKRSSFEGTVDMEGHFLPDSLQTPDGKNYDRVLTEIYTMAQVWCGEHKTGDGGVVSGGVTTARGIIILDHVAVHKRPGDGQELLWMISPLFAPDEITLNGKDYPLKRSKVTAECFADATNESIWKFIYRDEALTKGAAIWLTDIDQTLVSEGENFRVEVRVEGDLQHADPPAALDRGQYFGTLFMVGFGLQII